ncbi:hypothetical protein [Natronoflexus pectinivorans]|uniref:Outer membrane protein with beta-barrel domain n=1 Tax=Natronoflexus pectinivorans TaxID=682526 RepID=A0A4R2GNZ4_9BACT|nr:hypothetical protein [Natronoflexus pectinivorans]TCO10429.1 hypothetical protein EV194_10159 [Natronoflexus pectinivorans]
MKLSISLFLVMILSPFFGGKIFAQSKLLLNPGISYNGTFLEHKASGVGLLMGVEYKPLEQVGLEFRARYAFYSFHRRPSPRPNEFGEFYYPNDGKSIFEYRFNCPQIAIVPKFYQDLDIFYDGLFLYLETEFAVGYMSGEFEYNGEPSAVKRFTEPISFYAISIGLEHRIDNSHLKKRNWIFFGSFGYSSLNFRENIRKHQPENYQGRIPNQDAGFMLNFGVKLPLWSKK